ncbi:hypothetical protein AKJ44_02065 [candidate division MSBL1 archaeon SCGC-AAA261F17]|uniref:DUF6788 domain-containing protein n=1 Tax=candidate division MSBL1 archaeon SCGC-AAA261F17 TaxID=1698274 RepID=A0A133V5Y3_9EURY|nr:hypothetical protein AKJ44_02065 [candidate division MSBL1 archaeon SCGC-AAA261F17]
MSRYEELKEKTHKLGELSPGTIQERWLTCGNPDCRCARGERHGPYYYFAYPDRKTGKTAQISIPEDVVAGLKARIKNYEKFREELWELVEIEAERMRKGE